MSFVAKISDCDFSFKPKYSYPEKESNEDVKPYLKSIIYRNLIRKDDGVLTMAGIEAYICPYLYMLKLVELIHSKNISKVDKFAEDVGNVVGKIEYSWLRPIGKFDKNEFLKNISELYQVNGYGNLIFDKDLNGFKIINNLDWYKKYFDETVICAIKLERFNIVKKFLEYTFEKDSEMKITNNYAKLSYNSQMPKLSEVQKNMFNKAISNTKLDRKHKK